MTKVLALLVAILLTLSLGVGRAQYLGNVGTTTVTSCGATPNGSVIGDNTHGSIAVGGGVVTSCTLTFSHTLSVTPRCLVTTSLSTVTPGVVESASSVVMTLSITLGGGRINYWCFNPAAIF